MIYSKTDKENSIYKVSHFGLHFFEVRLQEDISIQDFDNKYKIQNYNGHFTLSLHQVDSNIEYRLYYKDILVGSCIGYFFILFVMHTILLNMNLDSWLFEYKVKKEELLEYFQYFIWDKRNTKVWYMNQFNQKFHEKSNLSINHYKGDISIKRGKLNIEVLYKEDVIFIFHPYTSDEIFSIFLSYKNELLFKRHHDGYNVNPKNPQDLTFAITWIVNELLNSEEIVNGISFNLKEKDLFQQLSDFYRYICLDANKTSQWLLTNVKELNESIC